VTVVPKAEEKEKDGKKIFEEIMAKKSSRFDGKLQQISNIRIMETTIPRNIIIRLLDTSDKKKNLRNGDVAQEIECLPSKHETPSSNPSTDQKNKKSCFQGKKKLRKQEKKKKQPGTSGLCL
jgi:hypothetical protein